MVDEVERFGLEDQLMVFVTWDDVEGLLQRGVVALEAGPVDGATRAARSEGTRGSRLVDAG